MEYSVIKLEINNNIATIFLNREKASNAINDAMIDEMIDACHEVSTNDNVRVVILRGEGKAFCGGGDVKEMVQTRNRDTAAVCKHMDHFSSLVKALFNIPKPVVAAVEGIAVGAGANLVLACDIIVATEETKFSEIFAQLGLIPDAGGTYLLTRAVGKVRAMEMIFTKRMIPASEALEMGMINKLVKKENLEATVMEYAEMFAEGPTLAYKMVKKLVQQSFETNFETAMLCESQCQSIALLSNDFQEGLSAFVEKRIPKFAGK